MTNTRCLIFTVLAAAAALSIGRQPARAEAPQFHVTVLRHGTGTVNPDAAASTIFVLQSGAGTLAPSDGQGGAYWPCFTGNVTMWPDCSSLKPGGVAIGQPAYTVPLAHCTNPSTPCAWFYFAVEDDNQSTSEDFQYSMTITQGAATILQTGLIDDGLNARNVIKLIAGNAAVGPGNCATATCVAPVAGEATITATAQVGNGKATSHQATINFQ